MPALPPNTSRCHQPTRAVASAMDASASTPARLRDFVYEHLEERIAVEYPGILAAATTTVQVTTAAALAVRAEEASAGGQPDPFGRPPHAPPLAPPHASPHVANSWARAAGPSPAYHHDDVDSLVTADAINALYGPVPEADHGGGGAVYGQAQAPAEESHPGHAMGDGWMLYAGEPSRDADGQPAVSMSSTLGLREPDVATGSAPRRMRSLPGAPSWSPPRLCHQSSTQVTARGHHDMSVSSRARNQLNHSREGGRGFTADQTAGGGDDGHVLEMGPGDDASPDDDPEIGLPVTDGGGRPPREGGTARQAPHFDLPDLRTATGARLQPPARYQGDAARLAPSVAPPPRLPRHADPVPRR